MKRLQLKHMLFDAAECLEALQRVRSAHHGFIQKNSDLMSDLEDLQAWLKEADMIPSEFNTETCREVFRRVLSELEEIAEEQQKRYDASPDMRADERMARTLSDYEVKKDFERALPMLM